jgi:hypothetical protein
MATTKVRKKTVKVDLFKERRDYFTAKTTPALVKLGPVKYLAVSGSGSPESEGFQGGIGAIYAVAYTLKFLKKAEGQDYKVSTLEALWWFGDEEPKSASPAEFEAAPRESWRWKVLVMVPDFIGKADVERAKKGVLAKRPQPAVAGVGLERINEGRVAQILHVGPYADEPASIAKMRELAAGQGLSLAGVHHEIYLNDPRRVSPDRIKTLLRIPVARA